MRVNSLTGETIEESIAKKSCLSADESRRDGSSASFLPFLGLD